MSHINVGFIDGRHCSRILKPPGGGYSELFFTNEEPVQKKSPPSRSESLIESILKTEDVQPEISPRRNSKSDRSSIQAIFQDETIEQTETKQLINKSENFTEISESIEHKIEGLKIEESFEATCTTTIPDNKEEEKFEETVIENGNKTPEVTEPKTPEAEQNKRRGRVPPGGFSSGLW